MRAIIDQRHSRVGLVRLRANGICNMFGRGATVLTPLVVVALFKAYGVGGVLSFMIALLVIQIFVVWAWGIEPARRGLETLSGRIGDIEPRTIRA